MPKSEKSETEKRIRIVQEWLIEDWPSQDIIAQINNKWGLEERQAKRYIKAARERWAEEDQEVIAQKRRLKIQTLNKLKRSLKDNFKGTPAGIRAIVAIEKEIILLDGLRSAAKVELTGKDGQPIRTENNTVVLYLPNNGRENVK